MIPAVDTQQKEVISMKLNRKILLVFVIAALSLAACGGSADEGAGNPEVSMTGAVETLVASFFETQTAMVTPTPLSTNTPLPTNTFLPTPTVPAAPLPTWTAAVVYNPVVPVVPVVPSVTGTLPTATQNTGALGFGCNNLAIVRDVNYPSGTTVKVGETITKTWKVQNTGSCEWNYNYALVIIQDENFYSTFGKLGKVVAPGSWAEVSVVLEVPKHDGTFTASWRLGDAGGNPFGATLTVSIVAIE